MDGKYVHSVHKMFGHKKITSFPILSMSGLVNNIFVGKIKYVRPLEYSKYIKKEAKEVLKKELNWVDYGGHHHESTFTKFFQSYMLPTKFGIDKRKTELSSWVRSGHIVRKEALKELEEPYPFDKKDLEYILSKLEMSSKEFEKIMNMHPKSFLDYPTYYPMIKSMRFPIKTAAKAS